RDGAGAPAGAPAAGPGRPAAPLRFPPPRSAPRPSTPAFQVATAPLRSAPRAMSIAATKPFEVVAAPRIAPARIIVAPPSHYVLSDPPPRPSASAWWTRLWRSAFGAPRPAPES